MRIGDRVNTRLVTQINDTRWKVESPSFPKDITAILVSRSSKLYNQNDLESFWIFDIQNNQILMSDTQFGRLPISDRMRPRYIHSLQSIISYLDSPQHTDLIQPDDLSEVKGMLNRCVRKDQWDWFTVYDAFDYPPIGVLAKTAKIFGELAKAYKKNDKAGIEHAIGNILELNIKTILNNGLTKILEITPRLNSAKTFSATPIFTFADDSTFIDKNANPYIISQVARVKLERANKSHEYTLQILVKTLQQNGFQVEYSRFIDAFCRLKTGPAIFEVKSITQSNERSQSRHALSQLYEYRYLHSVPDSSLWLVLSETPFSMWIVDYLENDRGVGVLWIENDTLQGRSYERLFRSWKGTNHWKSN